MATLRRNRSTQAYTLVDLNSIDDDELRKDIIADASEGGGTYGIRVVEESVNGAARFPIYGYYNDGLDADRWNAAKEQLGLSGENVDDSSVYQGAGVEVTDPRKEAALREAAAQTAQATADRIRAGEDADVEAITGNGTAAPRPTGTDHTVNIVDTGLAADATNRADDPAAADAAQQAARKSANKAPK